ncbi:DUF6586 family protein [Halomonas sp. GXIMD04776]|uniref:DUF6586 family protein n=1 Tax=Halomonas sp. GXIMD04776 TaxID=3415605 RepID=UPI003C8A11B5
MTPRGRTNQLIYQAELLLEVPAGDDEHAVARRMACEEGALALLELALDAALREITEHARLTRHDWRELLIEKDEDNGKAKGDSNDGIAELERLRELAAEPGTWLNVLIVRLEALQSVEGVARREAGSSLIVAADRIALGDELRWCLKKFKALLLELRETSIEW